MAEGNFWYERNGQPAGPIPATQMKSMVVSGELKRADLIWKLGTPGWVEAGTLPELFPEFPSVSELFPELPSLSAPLGRDSPSPSTMIPSRDDQTIAHFLGINPTWEAKRNILIACIIVPLLLPDFGPQLGGIAVIFLAAIAAASGFGIYALVCDATGNDVKAAIGCFLFTATVGVLLLFAFILGANYVFQFGQENARMVRGAADGGPRRTAIFAIILLFVAMIITIAYSRVDPSIPHLDASFVGTLLAFVVGVGFLEELVKLLPVAVLLGRLRSTWLVLFGPASSPSGQELTLTKKEALKLLGVLLVVVLSSAVPHAFYNTFLFHEMQGLALLVDGLVIWLAVWIGQSQSPLKLGISNNSS